MIEHRVLSNCQYSAGLASVGSGTPVPSRLWRRPEGSDFVPAIQKRGVYMHMAWHMAYGDYPMRKIEFVTESADALRRLFNSSEWDEMESQLKRYISDYERKVVDYRSGFQL